MGSKRTGVQRTGAQDAAVVCLASGGTLDQAAHAAGVDRSTVWRWRQEEGFRARLSEVRQAVREDGLERLKDLQARALEVLAWHLDVDGKDQLRAALEVLDRTGLVRGERHEHDSEGLVLRIVEATQEEADAVRERVRKVRGK